MDRKALEFLARHDIEIWIKLYGIRNENGDKLDFVDHFFLLDVFADMSPKQAWMKGAQLGLSTTAILKVLWMVKNFGGKGLNAIYTMPTSKERNEFVNDKVNRIIVQNPILLQYTEDRDTVEQKQLGSHKVNFRGTWGLKDAMTISSDLNVYDEVDASNQIVVEQYATRLQHSPHKMEWYFSHPSAQDTGVDKYFQRSDQKHYFHKCPACNEWQYLSWPDSFDEKRRIFVCKKCGKEMDRHTRRKGQWVKKFEEAEYSGYWIPLLLAPWVTAGEILDYRRDKTEEYFYNKVLGLPYVGGGNKLSKQAFQQNLTPDNLYPDSPNDRVVIGMDTGKNLHYTCASMKGLFYYGVAADYDEIEHMMERWPKAILVIDQGGDLIGSRKMREKYRGRCFLASYGEDRKTEELVRWGANDESGMCVIDRNRMLQLVVDEFTDSRFSVMGDMEDNNEFRGWLTYFAHWRNLTRVIEEDMNGRVRKIWRRNGDDHWAHATAYMRAGLSRFSDAKAEFIKPAEKMGTVGSFINPDGMMTIPRDPLRTARKRDWRSG